MGRKSQREHFRHRHHGHPHAPPIEIPPGIPQRPPDTPSAFSFGLGYYEGVPIRSFETYPPRKVTAYKDAAVDTDTFLAMFPEFDGNDIFPRAMIEGCAKRAWFYCSRYSQCDQLDGDDRMYAQALMTAHLIVIVTRQKAVVENKNTTVSGLPSGVVMVGQKTSVTGQMGTTGMVTSASIGGESVSLTLPQSQSAWEYWLNQTMYGVEYQAFMSSHVPVGIYAEGDDFRLTLRD